MLKKGEGGVGRITTSCLPRQPSFRQIPPEHLQEIVLKKGEGGVGAVVIGRIPLMLRSDRCVLKGKDEAQLARLGVPTNPTSSLSSQARTLLQLRPFFGLIV